VTIIFHVCRLNESIEMKQTRLLSKDPNIIAEIKIINASEETDGNVIFTKHDNGRRADPIHFKPIGDLTAQFYNGTLDVAKHCGIIDPRVEMINSQGNWGCDVLVKLDNTGEQEDHTDSSIDPRDPVFLSYADTLKHKEKYECYDSRVHGAVNVFTNNSRTKGDCLVRPDGSAILLPILTTTFVAGYLPHHGSGNYSQEPVFKKFGYGDCPDFYRAGSAEQFKVFFHNLYEVVIFKAFLPHTEVYHKPLHAYNCILCGDQDYFTDPYCAHCMLSEKNLLLYCKGSSNSFALGIKYVGAAPLNTGDKIECEIVAEIMNEENYHARFKESFRNFGIVCAIKLPQHTAEEMEAGAEDFNTMQYYLVYLVKRSFLAAMQTSKDPTKCNVELVNFLAGQGGPFLRATQPITRDSELILRATNFPLFWDLIIASDKNLYLTATRVMAVHEKSLTVSTKKNLKRKGSQSAEVELDFDCE
jgi:hypothetical protein